MWRCIARGQSEDSSALSLSLPSSFSSAGSSTTVWKCSPISDASPIYRLVGFTIFSFFKGMYPMSSRGITRHPCSISNGHFFGAGGFLTSLFCAFGQGAMPRASKSSKSLSSSSSCGKILRAWYKSAILHVCRGQTNLIHFTGLLCLFCRHTLLHAKAKHIQTGRITFCNLVSVVPWRSWQRT